jgi:hypothetical protein
MKRSLILTATTMILAGGAASAVNLTGTYSLVGNDSCAMSFSQFSGNPPELFGGQYGTPPIRTINGAVQGFGVLNSDGTGTMMVNNSWVVVPYSGNTVPGSRVTIVNPFLKSTYDATIAFTYTVTGDDFTITETSETGFARLFTRDTLTVTGAPTINGTISKNTPPVLQTATGTPAQEVWSFDWAIFYAMWLRTRTFTQLRTSRLSK